MFLLGKKMKLFEQTLSMLGSYWWMLDPGTDNGQFNLNMP